MDTEPGEPEYLVLFPTIVVGSMLGVAGGYVWVENGDGVMGGLQCWL